jgi:hypothetical protein
MLFWTCYLGGTLGPVLGSYLMGVGRQPLDDRLFLLSWLLWLDGAVLLIACVWSVRAILLRHDRNSREPAWLYRTFGWIALLEVLLWGYTVVRAI